MNTLLTKQQASEIKKNVPTTYELISQLIDTIINKPDPGVQQQS